jgi:lactoylglutathione lyase
MTDVIQGFDAISYHVRDIKKARQFYTHVLGLKELHFDEKMESLTVAVPDGPKISVHVQGPDEPGRPAGTITGFALLVSDIARSVAEIKKRGGNIVDEPSKRPWGVTYATVADPDGNEILLAMR